MQMESLLVLDFSKGKIESLYSNFFIVLVAMNFTEQITLTEADEAVRTY